MIKLNDLAIGYNGEAILEHIDQEFDDGLIYGILAKSGAGKTTLLKTISGLLHPVHGEVVIDGTTYRNADKNPVYMMHQRYSNFGWLSCTENVLIAQRDKKLRSRDDAIKVLAAVGLEQYADKWPSQLLIPAPPSRRKKKLSVNSWSLRTALPVRKEHSNGHCDWSGSGCICARPDHLPRCPG